MSYGRIGDELRTGLRLVPSLNCIAKPFSMAFVTNTRFSVPVPIDYGQFVDYLRTNLDELRTE